MLVPINIAKHAARNSLLRAGVGVEAAELQVDLLLEADLTGRPSHGLMRLPRIVERIRNGVTHPTVTGVHHWRGSFLKVDGQDGLGPVVACAALDSLIDASSRGGISIAAIRNNNHLGMLAWYARRVATKGLVLIAASTSEALVHPWGGRRAMLGTNPLAIGIPTPNGPFVFDMATSIVSMGQIHDHALRGVDIPAHWALDAHGNQTTDPEAARAGSIAPFGEAKGYALGLALEVLVTAIAGSAIGTDVVGTLDSTHRCNKGDLFIVIDSQAGLHVGEQICAYLDAVRASGAQGKLVAVPGDRSARVRAESLEKGISLADNVWSGIQAMAGQRNRMEST